MCLVVLYGLRMMLVLLKDVYDCSVVAISLPVWRFAGALSLTEDVMVYSGVHGGGNMVCLKL